MQDNYQSQITLVKSNYLGFIQSCCNVEKLYSLTPKAESSAYVLCFAIFGYHLLGETQIIEDNREFWDKILRQQLRNKRVEREKICLLKRDKPYLQLLTFTLSALSILNTLRRDPLSEEILSLIPDDIEKEFDETFVLQGQAKSGNHAMFIGILLVHARDYLGQDMEAAIQTWVRLHLESMNQYGFWGSADSMSHLQFQNGYHQYELLEYLDADVLTWSAAADAVAILADSAGHFAPYPGGGGCYDYDAVFLLTAAGPDIIDKYSALLKKTAASIISEQNIDGGFCESHYIRPRTFSNIIRSCRHIMDVKGRARVERIRMGLTLLRPKHDRIHTHWSLYSREWSESDLWDSWFRMLTIARIDVAFDPSAITRWGFIDYPGIGYHPQATL